MNDIPEGFAQPLRCRNHPEREVDGPAAFRLCAECRQAALDRYVDQAIRADRDKFTTSTQWDTDTAGAPLRGHGSREAGHARHMAAIKEKTDDK